MFRKNYFYTRPEIYKQLGGGIQPYLPTVKNKVVCACLTKRLNPCAPNIILVGVKPRVKKSAELLCMQKEVIPVFIKIRVNKWQYQGQYKVIDYTTSRSEIARYSKMSGRINLSKIIYLKAIQ